MPGTSKVISHLLRFPQTSKYSSIFYQLSFISVPLGILNWRSSRSPAGGCARDCLFLLLATERTNRVFAKCSWVFSSRSHSKPCPRRPGAGAVDEAVKPQARESGRSAHGPCVIPEKPVLSAQASRRPRRSHAIPSRPSGRGTADTF